MTAFVLLMLAALPAAGFIGWHVRDIPARMREMELQTALAASEGRWRKHWDVCRWLPAKPSDDTAQFLFRIEPEQHPQPSGRVDLPAPNPWPDPPGQFKPEAQDLNSEPPNATQVDKPWPDPPPSEDGPDDALAAVATKRTWSAPVKSTQVEEAVPCPDVPPMLALLRPVLAHHAAELRGAPT